MNQVRLRQVGASLDRGRNAIQCCKNSSVLVLLKSVLKINDAKIWGTSVLLLVFSLQVSLHFLSVGIKYVLSSLPLEPVYSKLNSMVSFLMPQMTKRTRKPICLVVHFGHNRNYGTLSKQINFKLQFRAAAIWGSWTLLQRLFLSFNTSVVNRWHSLT